MSDLAQAIAKHFRMPASASSFPMLVKTRKWGRNVGRLALGRVMNELGLKRGVEIGTCRAESALQWCQAMPGLQLTCVDPYKPYHANVRQDRLDQWHKEAQQKISESEYDIDLWRMSSRDAVSRFADESVDFVYIDGDHTFDAVMMDLLQYAPKVRRPGGIIALHDYCHVWDGGVVEAVDAYTKTHAVAPWYVTYDFAPTAFWQRGAERA